jgi:hypothetical protein
MEHKKEIPYYITSDYRSLEMHRMIAEKILKDHSLIQIALKNIDRWSLRDKGGQPYLQEWLEIMKGRVDDLVAFMTSETQEAQRLRSSNPFSGILSQKERNAVFKKWRSAEMRHDA